MQHVVSDLNLNHHINPDNVWVNAQFSKLFLMKIYGLIFLLEQKTCTCNWQR